MKLPKAISFDNFGTIIDWEGEIQKYFEGFMKKKGVDTIAPKEIQHRWEEIQFEYIQQEYKPYFQVLKDTMGMTCDEYGISFTNQDCEEFADGMGHWQPFADSHDALLELKKYTKVTLITNTDNDIIKESVKQIGVEFDDIVTAEMAGAYKPSHKGFYLSQKRLGLTEKDILHEEWKGKIEVTATVPVENEDDLSLAYTPGVAQPCLEIQKDISKSYELTRRWNMEKLCLGYDELKKINPGIIYGSVSGFGHTGPYSKRAGYDIIGQAMSGLMSTTGWPGGEPTRTGTAIGDVMGGISCCTGILAALYNKAKTGEGEKVDVALVDSMVSSLEIINIIYLCTGRVPERIGNRYESLYPYDSFHAKDGSMSAAILSSTGIVSRSIFLRTAELLLSISSRTRMSVMFTRSGE